MQQIGRLLTVSGEIPGHPAPDRAYLDHSLQVPEGIRQLEVTLAYHREEPEWDVILLAFGPDGFRGDAGLDASRGGPTGDVELRLVIDGSNAPGPAAPATVAGGEWLIQIWAGHVNIQLPYQIRVDGTWDLPTAGGSDATRGWPVLERPVDDRPGWYTGELHTHTTASDGHVTPQELAERARLAGLQFLAITDHNTINAWTPLAEVQDLCVIPSLEITVPEGHCNLFGLRRWVDWRVAYRGRTMGQTIDDARAQGAVVSVNHPFAPGYHWKADVELSQIDCIEIVNYPAWWPASTEYNLMALGLWTSMLNAGHRISAVGGSDAFHQPPGQRYKGARYSEAVGQPATCVYAERLSGLAILDSLRQGKAYVTMGPRLSLEAQAGTGRYTMGQCIESSDTSIRFDLEVRGAPEGSVLRWIGNGRTLAEHMPSGPLTNLHYRADAGPGQWNWYRVDLFDREGEIWAVSNPIYVGRPPSEPRETWAQAVARAYDEGMIIEQTILK